MAEERIGGSFAIDITNLKAGLQEANRLIRQSESEFRASAAGLDNWTKSEEGLTKRQQTLNSQIDIQKSKIAALIKEKENVIKKMKEEGKSQEEIDKAIDGTNKQITKESKALDKLKGDLDKTNKSLDDLQDESKNSGSALQKASEMADNASGKFTVMKGALANLVADGFRTAISAAKEFITSMVDVGKSFDSAMAQVSAVSGATGKDLEVLRAKAKEMGESTKFTATEAADAFNYMAMAGWKTEDMLGGIEGILNLAAASGADLATTSDIVTDALTAMGYTAKDAGRLADVMAAASSNANTNVEMMGATFQYAAPLVGALGYNMEDTAVAIGLMANAGIKGEKAGTALRSMFTRLAAPPTAAKKAMDELSLSLTDTSGKMKPFSQVVNELRGKFDGLSETEQAHYASAIAGQEAMSGLLAIVNAAPSDFDKLTKAVAESDGAAQKMADTMIDNLGGDITILQSKLEGIKIQVYEKFEPTLRKGIQSVQKWLNKTDWDSFSKRATKSLGNVIDTTVEFGKQALPIAKSVLKVMGGALKFVAENFGTLAKVTLTAVTAFKAFSAVMKVTTAISAAKTAIAGLTTGVGLAAKAQAGWNAVMSANPIGAVITAVGLLAGGIALLANSQKDAKEKTDLLNAEQRKAVTAAEEAATAYRDTKAAADEMAGAELANIDYTKSLWGELQTLADENGKVKEGYEGRAQFILNELNNALGTEYTMNGNVIQSYKDIKKSIDDVIQSKKAQILLEAYEDSYREAVKNVAEAEKERALQAQGVVKAQENVKKAEEEVAKAYENALATGSSAAYDLWEQKQQLLADEKEKLKEQQEAYNQSNENLQKYYSDIDSYEIASGLIMQGETDKAIEYLSRLNTSYKNHGSTAKEVADNKRKHLEEEVINAEVNLRLLEEEYAKNAKNMTDEEKKQAEQRIKNAKAHANDVKQQFKDVGGNITKGIAKGAEDEEWTLTGAMKKLINKALAAARNAAKEHSPSRLFRDKVGIGLPQGVAVGVEKGTKYVINSVKKQISDIKDAYDLSDIPSSVSLGVKASANNNGNTAKDVTSGGVVVNQYNTYSQAHSRYELYKSKQQTAAAVRLAMGTV